MTFVSSLPLPTALSSLRLYEDAEGSGRGVRRQEGASGDGVLEDERFGGRIRLRLATCTTSEGRRTGALVTSLEQVVVVSAGTWTPGKALFV